MELLRFRLSRGRAPQLGGCEKVRLRYTSNRLMNASNGDSTGNAMRSSAKIALSVALMTMVAQFSFGMAALADDHDHYRRGIAITTEIVTTGSMALQARSPARAYPF
jgi:hypothetical protein